MGDGTFVNAIVQALKNQSAPREAEVKAVSSDVRIDGKTCLVTGANSGLGKSIALDLARRGGNLFLACRPGHEGLDEEVRQASGSDMVELLDVDLADLESVHQFCDTLRDREIRIDIAVFNAGLMTRNALRTPQGYDTMFVVHFLSSRIIIDRWLRDGILNKKEAVPRIIFVSSEAHRSSYEIDFDRLGEFIPFTMKESLKHYGLSKLMLCTYATELSRRLNPEKIQIAVHSLCPGGVATNIARDSPKWLSPIAGPVMKLFFPSPDQAIDPVVYFCCDEEAGQDSGIYLHMMQRKEVSESARNGENGNKLWFASQRLVDRSYEDRAAN